MFEYFPDNYGWSFSLLMALGMGVPISDIDPVCAPLKPLAANGPAADGEWMRAWANLGDRYEALATTDGEQGRERLARVRHLRAATCLLLAERQVTHKTDETLAVYLRGLDSFRRGVSADDPPVEFVEVPFAGSELPALFVPAPGSGPGNPAPCVVHFDGLDVMKELIYMFGVSRLPDQGVSVLICDHPGVGEALRLRGLPLDPRVEQPAAACVDYLESRSEIDGERIGIMALSLGGYYAPRVAAFEPRFSCCVVWGACWDAVEVDHFMRSSEGEASVNLVEQLSWVFDMEPGPAVKMLEHFRVESFMDRISCPILVVHGGEDQQVPSWTAENTYNAAVASEQRELKIFEAGEGASAHCQVDDLEVGTQYMFDWISATLRGVPGAPVAPASSTVPD